MVVERMIDGVPVEIGPCGERDCPNRNDIAYFSIFSLSSATRIWRCMEHVSCVDLGALMETMGRPLFIDLFAC